MLTEEELQASRNIIHHEDAGCDIEDLPYDPDLGDNQWQCKTHDRFVEVPGWL
jgi:hypothetical protein